ncbi:structural protein P5 [Pantoea ananatis BRT98]|uniref:hypothetical protein n=1 Tax=Pantoea ananas TaxID=553 RepID=UPI001EE5DF95|nr:hypothetical protein [Pantoea ananatis]PKC39101.1 structural protein P5 [Pantoea ananatis BRT98]
MANVFDFTLAGNDEASAAIARIEEAVRKLEPELDKTRDALKLGGQESAGELNTFTRYLQGMSQAARDNVQFIGDMVPPLKMVGELAGRFGGIAGRMGVAGVATYGLARGAQALAGNMKEAADNAYSLDVAAKNSGMRVDDFSRLAGAMQILGADSDGARASVEGMYKTFNDALQGRNGSVLSVLSQMGVQIVKNKYGTADVMRTFEQLAQVFPSLTPDRQKTVADSLGLDASGLALLRDGAKLKAYLTRADELGLTVDPKVNTQLVELNRNLTGLSAAWDGFKNRVRQKVARGLLSDGSVNDGLRGIGHLMQNPGDPVALNEAIGNLRGNEGDWVRRARDDKKYLNSLPASEQVNLITGQITDKQRRDLRERYGLGDQASVLQGDIAAALKAPSPVAPTAYTGPGTGTNARGIRNNNPGNLRDAPNSSGSDGSFVRFPTPHDGMAALSRQLQLYADRGNNTLNGIIHTYAPATENKTQNYIDDVAAKTGFDPRERINLHDPDTLRRVMSAIISHENGAQPYTDNEINHAIHTSINDDRWMGLRDPQTLQTQRQAETRSVGGKTASPAASASRNINPPDGSVSSITAQKTPSAPVNPEQKVSVEVTLVNDKTGERKQIISQGGRVATSMAYP